MFSHRHVRTWLKYLLYWICAGSCGCQTAYRSDAGVSPTDSGSEDAGPFLTDTIGVHDVDSPEEGLVDGLPDVSGRADAPEELGWPDGESPDVPFDIDPDADADARLNDADAVVDRDSEPADVSLDAMVPLDADDDTYTLDGDGRMIWGAPINGELTVEVVDILGRPLQHVFVQVGLDASEGWHDRTDAAGRVVFAVDGLVGPQTITATSAQHAAMTYWGVESNHVRMELRTRTTDVQVPYGVVDVRIVRPALDPPRPGWRRRYGASLTVPRGKRRVAPSGRLTFGPDTGARLYAQPGPCAVIVVVGDEEDTTPSRRLRPLMMGVHVIDVVEGGQLTLTMVADIPVDQVREVQLPALAGWYSGAQDTVMVSALIDLGQLGLAAQPFARLPPRTTLESLPVPVAVGALDGAEIEYRLAYSDQDLPPYSLSKFRTLLSNPDRIVFREPVAVPQITSPLSDGTLIDSEFVFISHPHGQLPTFYRLEVFSEATSEFRWDFILPGNLQSFSIPQLYPMPELPSPDDSLPDTTGSLDFHIFSINEQNTYYRSLPWLALDGDGWDSFVWDRHRISFQ